jgi:hypothetical protein
MEYKVFVTVQGYGTRFVLNVLSEESQTISDDCPQKEKVCVADLASD